MCSAVEGLFGMQSQWIIGLNRVVCHFASDISQVDSFAFERDFV